MLEAAEGGEVGAVNSSFRLGQLASFEAHAPFRTQDVVRVVKEGSSFWGKQVCKKGTCVRMWGGGRRLGSTASCNGASSLYCFFFLPSLHFSNPRCGVPQATVMDLNWNASGMVKVMMEAMGGSKAAVKAYKPRELALVRRAVAQDVVVDEGGVNLPAGEGTAAAPALPPLPQRCCPSAAAALLSRCCRRFRCRRFRCRRFRCRRFCCRRFRCCSLLLILLFL